jgi:phthiocerol/phenolphthiocerol synthesis type-I polyketide synthase C
MASGDEIAIVGYAGRLPGARNAGAFWSLLQDNRSSVGWVTPDRFPTQAYYHPSTDKIGRSYTFAAGLIDDVWGFDAAAFGMSPREAEQVDPQQRHLLEVTHDALAHAGIRPSRLVGSGTGVYIGASSVDYGARFFADPSAADVHMMTGNTLSIIANRLSYNFDLHGPSFTVDTACSSSLVALSLAADAIRNGTVETAIVGGVNLLLSPFSFVGFSRASMLSPTGRCRPFDAAADGYVRAEGAIVLVLRSIAAARKARMQRLWARQWAKMDAPPACRYRRQNHSAICWSRCTVTSESIQAT